jgi:hypothetical protein
MRSVWHIGVLAALRRQFVGHAEHSRRKPNAAWMHRHLSCAVAKLGDLATVAHSVDSMRRVQPHLTVSLLVENYPVADPDWLEAA